LRLTESSIRQPYELFMFLRGCTEREH
jgi:hypothetical protein